MVQSVWVSLLRFASGEPLPDKGYITCATQWLVLKGTCLGLRSKFSAFAQRQSYLILKMTHSCMCAPDGFVIHIIH